MIERQKTKYVTLRDYLSVGYIPEEIVTINFIKDNKIIKTKNIKDITDDELNMLIDSFELFNDILTVKVLYKEYNINDEDVDKVDDEYYQFEEVD